MITGVHALLYSHEPEALREFIRDALGFDFIDSGGGWLIFKLPSAELGVHPAPIEDSGRHQLSFMCDDLDATMRQLTERGVTFNHPPSDEGYGLAVEFNMPGGATAELYQPFHETP